MADLRVFMEDETLTLDPQMDYQKVEGLSSEVKERLGKVRPTTIVSISSVFSLEYLADDWAYRVQRNVWRV